MAQRPPSGSAEADWSLLDEEEDPASVGSEFGEASWDLLDAPPEEPLAPPTFGEASGDLRDAPPEEPPGLEEVAFSGTPDEVWEAVERTELSEEFVDLSMPWFLNDLQRAGHIERDKATGKFWITHSGKEAPEEALRGLLTADEEHRYKVERERVRRLLGKPKLSEKAKAREMYDFLEEYHPSVARRALQENPAFAPSLGTRIKDWATGPHDGLDQFMNSLFGVIGAPGRALKVGMRNKGTAMDVAQGVIPINERVWKAWLEGSDWNKATQDFKSKDGKRSIKAGDYYRLNDDGDLVEQIGAGDVPMVRAQFVKHLVENEEQSTGGTKNSEILRWMGFRDYHDLWPDEQRDEANRGWIETVLRDLGGPAAASIDPEWAREPAEKIGAAIELPIQGLRAFVNQADASVEEGMLDIQDVLVPFLWGKDDRRKEPESFIQDTPGAQAAMKAARELGLVRGMGPRSGPQEFPVADVGTSVLTDIALDPVGLARKAVGAGIRKLPSVVHGLAPGPLTRRGAAQFEAMEHARLREALINIGDAGDDVSHANLTDKLTAIEIRNARNQAKQDWLSTHNRAQAFGASVKDIGYEVDEAGRVLGVTGDWIDDTAAPLVKAGDNEAIIPWAQQARTEPGFTRALDNKLRSSWADRVVAPLREMDSPGGRRARGYLKALFGGDETDELAGISYESLKGRAFAPVRAFSDLANRAGGRKKLGESDRRIYDAVDQSLKEKGWTEESLRAQQKAFLEAVDGELDELLSGRPDIDKAAAQRFIRDVIESNNDIVLSDELKLGADALASFVHTARQFQDEVLQGRFGMAFRDAETIELVADLEALQWRQHYRDVGKTPERDELFKRLFGVNYSVASAPKLDEIRLLQDELLEHLGLADDIKEQILRKEATVLEPTSGKVRTKKKEAQRARRRSKLRREMAPEVKRLKSREAQHRKVVAERREALRQLDNGIRAEATAVSEAMTARKLAEFAADGLDDVSVPARRFVDSPERLAAAIGAEPTREAVDKLQRVGREVERLERGVRSAKATQRVVGGQMADAAAKLAAVRGKYRSVQARVKALSSGKTSPSERVVGRLEADLGALLGVEKVAVGAESEFVDLLAVAKRRMEELAKVEKGLIREHKALRGDVAKMSTRLKQKRLEHSKLVRKPSAPKRKLPETTKTPSPAVAKTRLQEEIAAAQSLLDEKLGADGGLELFRNLGEFTSATPRQIVKRALEDADEAFAFDAVLARAFPEYDLGLTKTMNILENLTDREAFILSDYVKTQGRGGRYQGLPEGYEFLQPVINHYRQFFDGMLETLQSQGLLQGWDVYDFLDRMDVGSYVFHTLSRSGAAQARLGARASASFAKQFSSLDKAAPFLKERRLVGTASEIDELMRWNTAEDIARWQAESNTGAAREFGYTVRMAREGEPPPDELIHKIMEEMPDELTFFETDISEIAQRYVNHASGAIGNKVFMDDLRGIVDAYYPEAKTLAAAAEVPGQRNQVEAMAKEMGFSRLTGAEHAAFLMGAKFPTGDKSLLRAMDVLARNGLSPEQIRKEMLTKHGLQLSLDEATMVKNSHVYLPEDLTNFVKAQAGDSELAQAFRAAGDKFPELQTGLELWDNLTTHFKGLATVARTMFHGRNQIGGTVQNVLLHGKDAVAPTTQLKAILLGLGHDLDAPLTIGSRTQNVRDWLREGEALGVITEERSAADLIGMISEDLVARGKKPLSREVREKLSEELQKSLAGGDVDVWDDLIKYTYERLKKAPGSLKDDILSTPAVVAEELADDFKAIKDDIANVRAGHLKGPAGRLLSTTLSSGAVGAAAGLIGGGPLAGAAFGAGAILSNWAAHIPAERLVRLGSQVARAGENHLRLANWIAGMEKGMGGRDPAHWVNRALFDYSPSGMSWFEFNVMRRLFPFYVFRSRNLAYQAWLMRHRPQEMANMLRILNGATHFGSTPEQRAGLPPYMQGRFVINTGSGFMLSGLGIPVEDSLDLLRSVNFGVLEGVPGSAGLVSSLNPWPLWLGENLYGKSFFFDRDIADIRSGRDYGSVPIKFFQEILGISPDDPNNVIGTLEPTKWWIPETSEAAAKRAYVMKRLDQNFLLQQWYRMFAESYQEATGEMEPSDLKVTGLQRGLALTTGIKPVHTKFAEQAEHDANRKFLGYLRQQYERIDPRGHRGGRISREGGVGPSPDLIQQRIDEQLERFLAEREGR